MELRELAEQVLFATSLEEKLRSPAVVTDERPGPAISSPDMPGRPAELRFKPRGAGKAEFPGTRRLEVPEVRGRLLHFFANHELLATELMALVLLRFPEAPPAFRQGVLRTLRDEQEHTRLYLARMAECGIAFGELPVSGYFWRSLAPMACPMDFVGGLSLTFEQANLDFAGHFARGFAAVGDTATAALLEQIHRDEIAHVAHGLKWFRRWKDPGEDDWDAFCRVLKFPLSPQRAKGSVFDVASRRAAGLDPTFIARLDVYSVSKGRTPHVSVFNPFAEATIAYGKTFVPVAAQAKLARDLANLPQFLGRQDDVVLVPRRPSVAFLAGLKQAGFPLPEFVEVGRTAADAAAGIASLKDRKLGGLRPWAWAPDSVELFGPLFGQVTGEKRTTADQFDAGIAQLYSKAWSATFLRRVLAASPEPWLIAVDDIGVAVDSLPQALAVVEAIRARGHHRVVAKESLGLAGSNAVRLWEPALLDAQVRWMTDILEKGRQLVIEPWLERVVDFSVQLEMDDDGLRIVGHTGLVNDLRGQFQANYADPDHARRLPSAVTDLFRGDRDGAARLPRFFPGLLPMLEVELRRVGHRGPLGIDAFVARVADGRLRLKPVVEINPRHTMGRLTLELMRHVAPGSGGRFCIESLSKVRKRGFGGFGDYARSLGASAPLRFEGEPVAKIREGAVCLNDPDAAEGYLAVFQVGRRRVL
jgi:uncharacterized ferritin-like protein (DUF455 family)